MWGFALPGADGPGSLVSAAFLPWQPPRGRTRALSAHDAHQPRLTSRFVSRLGLRGAKGKEGKIKGCGKRCIEEASGQNGGIGTGSGVRPPPVPVSGVLPEDGKWAEEVGEAERASRKSLAAVFRSHPPGPQESCKSGGSSLAALRGEVGEGRGQGGAAPLVTDGAAAGLGAKGDSHLFGEPAAGPPRLERQGPPSRTQARSAGTGPPGCPAPRASPRLQENRNSGARWLPGEALARRDRTG